MQAIDVFECFAYVPPIDIVAVANERGEECFVAQVVNHARNAEATFGYFFDRTVSELRLAIAACQAHAVANVELYFG